MTIDRNTELLGRTPGLAEEHFVHDGLITKRFVRAIALASLRPCPGEMLWDLGTGAGSIAVEWCRTDPRCRAVGVERKNDRAANARMNSENLTEPGQYEIIIHDLATGLPEGLPTPNAIFIGGGASTAIIEEGISRLQPGGRLVVHGVTMETEMAVMQWHSRFGGELARIGVENGDAIGRLRGWQPSRTVTAWTLAIGAEAS